MRVFCITSSYPTSPHDAAGRFVREHCQILHDAGVELTVFTWRRGVQQETPWEVVEVGWIPSDLSLFGGTGAPDTLDASPWRVAEGVPAVGALLTAALRRDAPDLWLGHWLMPGGVAARICASRTDRPSLVVGHSAGVHLIARMPARLREPLLDLVTVGATTVPSLALARKLGREVEVLPMGFHRIAPVGPRSDEVLCFGRMVPLKGFNIVPEALGYAGRKVHFAGDGPLRTVLARECRRRDVEAEFHGWIGELEKPALFGRADIALFPSRVLPNGRHEGWPVSVLEVSAAGVVPIVAGWPGAREMVANPDLQVVADWTPDSWREAIRRWDGLAADKKEALRNENAALARSFTWDAVGPVWVQKVREVARGA